MNLPAGATPVDFAYSIHTEVGHRAIGAKVSGKLVPLDYELRTGDTVEVLTSQGAGRGPPPGLAPVREDTAGAQQDPAVVQLGSGARTPWSTGRDALQRLMRKQNVPFKRLATEEALIGQVAAEMKSRPSRRSTSRSGRGTCRRSRSWRACHGWSPAPTRTTSPRCRSPARSTLRREEISRASWSRRAPTCGCGSGRCCTPVPGDEIMGFVTRGQGVSVHRVDCPNAKALAREPERLIEVSWAEGKPTSFTVAIQVEALDRTRLLSDVATVLSDHHVNILSATSATGRDRITRLRFTFELADITHLSDVLGAVKKVDGVFDAYRVARGRCDPARCGSSCNGWRAPRSRSTASRWRSSAPGTCLLVGAGRDDLEDEPDRLADKVANLRIFADAEGKMNVALADVGGEASSSPSSRSTATCARGGGPRGSAPRRPGRGRGARGGVRPCALEPEVCGSPAGVFRAPTWRSTC